MMDDYCAISTCGVEAVKSNALLNHKLGSKKLQCGTNKCKKKMHIGSTRNQSICGPLYIDGWKETDVASVETEITQNKDAYESKTF